MVHSGSFLDNTDRTGYTTSFAAGAADKLVVSVATESVPPITSLTFDGSTLTLDPGADLATATGYCVRVAATAIRDLAGNPFAGILDDTAWNFTTRAGLDTTDGRLAAMIQGKIDNPWPDPLSDAPETRKWGYPPAGDEARRGGL